MSRLRPAALLAVTLLTGCTVDGGDQHDGFPPPEEETASAQASEQLPLGEFPEGSCEADDPAEAFVDDSRTIVDVLPVFEDYPGSEGMHYDDRTGDYMDTERVVLGEEDAHRVEYAEDSVLLVVQALTDVSQFPADLVTEAAANPLERDPDGEEYCTGAEELDVAFIGETHIDYHATSPGSPTRPDADLTRVGLWELSAPDGMLITVDEDASALLPEDRTNRPSAAIVSVDIQGSRTDVIAGENALVKLPPPGLPASSAIKEPAFDILDYYDEQRED